MAPSDLSASPAKRGVGVGALIYDPHARGLFFQVALLLGLAALIGWIVDNTLENLAAQNKKTGFAFFDIQAGFQILTTPGSWAMDFKLGESTYLDVFWIGVINTLAISALGIVFATILGFIIGVFRLSSNIVLRGFATIYVELLRNIPLLLQLFIWYKVVVELLPGKRGDPLVLFGVLQIDKSGVWGPFPLPQDGFNLTLIVLLAAIVFWYLLGKWAKARQDRTGAQFPTFWVGLGVLLLAPIAVYLVTGQPLDWEQPVRGNFGFRNGEGMVIKPEMFAVWMALTLYTASFIAEIVRAGILAVNKGQTEAAYALGLRAQPTLNLVVIPQAMRVIIPPLTSQFLNLTKNSSLAVAIAYPDLVSLTGIIANQVGQELETIFLLMMVYLIISLTISAFMNWYNNRTALVER